jgi:hypothetical protein
MDADESVLGRIRVDGTGYCRRHRCRRSLEVFCPGDPARDKELRYLYRTG